MERDRQSKSTTTRDRRRIELMDSLLLCSYAPSSEKLFRVLPSRVPEGSRTMKEKVEVKSGRRIGEDDE